MKSVPEIAQQGYWYRSPDTLQTPVSPFDKIVREKQPSQIHVIIMEYLQANLGAIYDDVLMQVFLFVNSPTIPII